MNYILRKAAKEYVCECCGHLIKKDTRYIDNIIVNNGKYVKHIRYHDECPIEHTTLDKVFKSLKECTAVPCIYKNEKYLIQGIVKNGLHIMYYIEHWTSHSFSYVNILDKDLKVVLDEELF